MPNFKKGDPVFFESDAEIFNKYFKPGEKVPVSGIYRCESCGFEAVSTAAENHPLPPAARCDSHHSKWKCNPGNVRWRLVAAAIHINT